MHTRTFCNYMHEKGISHLHNKIYNKVFSVKNNGLGDQRKILNCHLGVYFTPVHIGEATSSRRLCRIEETSNFSLGWSEGSK